MKKAVIDIGTNSIKFCLAEGSGDAGAFCVLRDETSMAKLGTGLRKTGLIGPVQLERNARATADFVADARAEGADEIAIVGTMALRVAKNTAEFAARVRELTGLAVRVIPGEEEALLSYAAVVSAIPSAAKAHLATFDTGGGSTEFVFGEAGEIKRMFSLNVGAIRFTEQYLQQTPVSLEVLAKARSAICRELREGGVGPGAKLLIGMGGNVTSMAAVKLNMENYDAKAVHGSTMTLDDVNAQIADYASKTLDERKRIPGLHPGRADIILAGACIAGAAMELCCVDTLTVSDRSLRHGLLGLLFSGKKAG